jgi:hypothetical protein
MNSVRRPFSAVALERAYVDIELVDRGSGNGEAYTGLGREVGSTNEVIECGEGSSSASVGRERQPTAPASRPLLPSS